MSPELTTEEKEELAEKLKIQVGDLKNLAKKHGITIEELREVVKRAALLTLKRVGPFKKDDTYSVWNIIKKPGKQNVGMATCRKQRCRMFIIEEHLDALKAIKILKGGARWTLIPFSYPANIPFPVFYLSSLRTEVDGNLTSFRWRMSEKMMQLEEELYIQGGKGEKRKAIPITVMLDTGATATLVDSNVLKDIGATKLPQQAQLVGIHGNISQYNIYVADFMIEHEGEKYVIRNFPVIEFPYLKEGRIEPQIIQKPLKRDMLMGLDLLDEFKEIGLEIEFEK